MEKLHETATERRRLTRNSIYRYLYDAPGGRSKQEIAEDLAMSLPTVHQNLTELLRAELVRPDGMSASTGGRRALRLTVAENARFAVGVSVSGDHFRMLAANLRLEEIAYRKSSHPRTAGLEELGRYLVAELEAFLTDFGLNRDKLLGVGVALPAILNAEGTRILAAPTMHLQNADLQPLTDAIPYPTLFRNDATSGGYAEWFARKETDSMAYLSLEGGVGGAVLMNGAPYTGQNGRSGEFGHICVQPGGLRCQCGKQGCLEAYCSSARISSDLGITVEQFFAGLEEGNAAYVTLWQEYLQHLAQGLCIIRMTLDCNIVLGGYLAQYLPPYLPELRRLTAALDPFDEDAGYVHLCHYPKHAASLGVALNFINRFLEQL
ncbi:ROK family transcriptional regulator [uncultured Gemmiger sp.]|uniref:ROK family transcriptional regulator n=1 Tax=uncultured Gemmiger sp. TaxID=1623490 RepID=UPI0025E779E8|nr:ROK family transcriptional regulator [uncultured Gemmiger sp.]